MVNGNFKHFYKTIQMADATMRVKQSESVCTLGFQVIRTVDVTSYLLLTLISLALRTTTLMH